MNIQGIPVVLITDHKKKKQQQKSAKYRTHQKWMRKNKQYTKQL